MNERTLACALNRLLACALRPVAVQNGNRLGRLRPSWPIGSFARTMTLSVSRSACRASMPGMWLIIRNASPSMFCDISLLACQNLDAVEVAAIGNDIEVVSIRTSPATRYWQVATDP